VCVWGGDIKIHVGIPCDELVDTIWPVTEYIRGIVDLEVHSVGDIAPHVGHTVSSQDVHISLVLMALVFKDSSDRVKCSRSVLSLVLVALVFKDSKVIESSVPGPCCDLFVQLIQSTLHALIVQ